MLLKESVDTKNQHLNMVLLDEEKTSSLIEDKKKKRRRGPTLVGTPKGTSH